MREPYTAISSFFVISLLFKRISTAFPKVITLSRPIYIEKIRTILLPMVMCGNTPELNPAVASAEVASKDNFK